LELRASRSGRASSRFHDGRQLAVLHRGTVEVLVVAAFITINTWTAVAKHENGWRTLSAPGTIYRFGLSNVY
jgi:hypothetical protein